MWPDRVSNPGPLTYEPGAQPTVIRGRANYLELLVIDFGQETEPKVIWPHLKFF